MAQTTRRPLPCSSLPCRSIAGGTVAADVRRQRCDLGALALGQKFARKPIGVDPALLALDVDADALSILCPGGDRDECGVAGMRDVEVDAMVFVKLRSTANTAPQSNCGRIE